MNDNFAKLLEEIDQLIRAGNVPQAREKLSNLSKKKLKRELLSKLAHLSWRSDCPEIGLLAIRNHLYELQDALPEEKVHYAACLIRLGAFVEADRILMESDVRGVPESLLYLAFSLFAQWNYEEAIPLLQRYLSTENLSDYARIVGMANLASALVYERRFQKASQVLHHLIYETGIKSAPILRSSCLQLVAVNLIFNQNWEEAKSFLLEARKMHVSTQENEAQGLDAFFIQKWTAILEFSKQPVERNLKAVIAVKSMATKMGHGETVRDCDRFIAMITKDRALITHIYFGTPYPSFRKRLLKDFGENIELPSSYRWSPSGSKITKRLVDLTKGSLSAGSKNKHLGNLNFRVLKALSSDFYQTKRSATLFLELFPDENFHPVFSINRLHVAVVRLRKTLKAEGVGLDIESSDRGYRLIARPGTSLMVGEQSKHLKEEVALNSIQLKFKNTAFRAIDVAMEFGVSKRSALRMINDGIARGLIDKTGSSKATSYFFKPMKKNAG